MKKGLLWCLAIWLMLRAGLQFFGVIALSRDWMPLYPGFPLELDSLGMWFRFDSTLYLRIIEQGYAPGYLGPSGWFPGYPLLAAPLVPFIGPTGALLAVSSLGLLFSLMILYRLGTLDSDSISTKRGLLLLVLFPSAFILSTAYSESVFLALAAASFLAVRKRYPLLAAVLATGATLTRLTGLTLIPALAWELYRQDKRFSKKMLLLLMPVLAPLAFFFHLRQTTGNFFEYFKVQDVYAKVLGIWPAISAGRSLMLEQKTGLVFLAIQFAILAYCWTSMRGSYRIFVVLSMFMGFYHTQGLCTQRFLLVLFPLFLVAGRKLNSKAYWVLLILSAICQLYFFTLWLYGYRATY